MDGIVNARPVTVRETCCDVPQLLQGFESLGENCDFGVVQRAVGIEPFGLFRFAACSAADLALLLRARFEPLGEPEDLWLDETGMDREYCVRSRRFSFGCHTDRYAGTHDAAEVLAAQALKLRFLKGQLLRDLGIGRRILIFKGHCFFGLMQKIATELQRYGPNCLVWVSVADDAHRPGTVQRISEGLLQGFVSRFGNYEERPSLPVDDWVAVCANAHRLWRQEELPVAPLHNLLERVASAAIGHDATVAVRRIDERGPNGDVYRRGMAEAARRG